MGAINEYKCPACHYACEVSGGNDRGRRSFSETCDCTHCKLVLDISLKGKNNFVLDEDFDGMEFFSQYPKAPEMSAIKKATVASIEEKVTQAIQEKFNS